MGNLKLIKCNGYWIVVSDEKPNKKDDLYIDYLVFPSLINYPLTHSGIEYTKDELNGTYKNPIIQSIEGTTSPKDMCWKVIASQNPEHNLPTITFSDEVAKELGIVDLEQLYPTGSKGLMKMPSRDEYNNSLRQEGYNQCLSDNTDKKFTLEDMRNAFKAGESLEYWKCMNTIENPIDFPKTGFQEDFIQSLTKEEYFCELEMNTWFANDYDGKIIPTTPKITNNSVTIRKIWK